MASGQVRYVSEFGVEYTSDGTALGKGAFGEVHSATRDSDGLQVAIKTKVNGGEQSSMLLLRDAGGDDNLMRLVDFVTRVGDPKQVRAIAVERLDRTLLHWICDYRKQHGAHFSAHAPEGVKLEIVRQHYSGLGFIHDNGLIHFDIHQCNVMVHKGSGRVKICDFGNSCYQVEGSRSRDKFRLTDLRASAALIAAPLWLNRNYTSRISMGDAEFHGEQAKYALENIFSTYGIPKLIMENPDWWESQDYNLKSTMLAVNDYNMAHPYRNGVAVPQHVAEILTTSLLLAPHKDCVAQEISAKLNAIVPYSVRAEARDFIRQT